MCQLLPLTFTATQVVVQAILNHREDTNTALAKHVIDHLKSDRYTAVSERIFKRLVDIYPSHLNNELLRALTPPHMREIVLKGCTNVSPVGLEDTYKRCQYLKALDLGGCEELIRASFFRMTGDLAPQLSAITIRECSSISDHGVRTLLQKLPNLCHLNLGSCDNLTDDMFLLNERIQFSKEVQSRVHGPSTENYLCQLISVDVSLCRGLTSKAVRYLTTLSGPTLQAINISYTDIDCIALWYLSGYNLSSAVELAVETDKLRLEQSGCNKDNHGGVLNAEGEKYISCDEVENEDSAASWESFARKISGENIILLEGVDEAESEDSLGSIRADNCASNAPPESALSPSRKTSGNDTSQGVPVVNAHSHGNNTDHPAEVGESGLSAGTSMYAFFQTTKSEQVLLEKRKHLHKSQGQESLVTQNYVEEVICVEDVELNSATSINFVKDASKTDLPMSADSPDLNIKYMHMSQSTGNQQCDSKLTELCNPTANLLIRQGYVGTDISLGLASKTYSDAVLSNCAEAHTPSICDHVSADNEFTGSLSEPSVHRQATCINKSAHDTLDVSLLSPSALSDTFKHSSGDCFANQPDTYENRTEENELLDSVLNFDESIVENVQHHLDIRTNKCSLRQVYEPNIKSICLSSINFHSEELGISCLKAFLHTNDKLDNLELNWKYFNDEGLLFIKSHSPNLTKIALTDCDSLTSEALADFFANCPKLEKVNLQGVCFISDHALVPLVTNQNIKCLNLAESNITDVSLSFCAQSLSNHLQDLNLNWCEEIGTEGVENVVRECKFLQVLSLRQCPVSNLALELIATNLTYLKYLNIAGINTLDDQALTAIAVQLPHLEKLDIAWNMDITDESVVVVMSHCLHLKELLSAGIKQVTSKPFLPIVSDSQRWKKSRALLLLKYKEQKVLSNDEHYSSDEEFEDLYCPHRSTCYAPNLRFLDLEYCDKIKDDLMAELVAICRGTLIIRDYYGSNIEPRLVSSRKGWGLYLAQ